MAAGRFACGVGVEGWLVPGWFGVCFVLLDGFSVGLVMWVVCLWVYWFGGFWSLGGLLYCLGGVVWLLACLVWFWICIVVWFVAWVLVVGLGFGLYLRLWFADAQVSWVYVCWVWCNIVRVWC